MSDHLPECVLPKGWGDCICDELRACEQRVREDERGRKRAIQTYEYGYAKGRADALTEAREAVAALFPYPDVPQPIRGETALASIDNLITKNSGENYDT
jgi:hypothetical protein